MANDLTIAGNRRKSLTTMIAALLLGSIAVTAGGPAFANNDGKALDPAKAQQRIEKRVEVASLAVRRGDGDRPALFGKELREPVGSLEEALHVNHVTRLQERATDAHARTHARRNRHATHGRSFASMRAKGSIGCAAGGASEARDARTYSTILPT